ncbi:glycoside hydrolase family 28 protein [Gaoshiqia sp. Z1-71]|uniref:glycoside hydrolase family 28 protein n=1 Tax=Gaoshiqia hydrogeniformans TaxID=3290090 RepID=UPI003BF8F27A
MKTLTLLFIILMAALISSAKVYNLAEMGADKQGIEKCTSIIHQAIEQAAADGGGTIFFPAGNYLTGPIHLKSNITLELEAGAFVRFSPDFDDYLPYVRVRYEGIFMKTFSPLIYAVGAENIAIKGEGTIDGNGKVWWTSIMDIMIDVRGNSKVSKPNKYQQQWVKENPDLVDSKYGRNQFFRPPFIQFIECENINIEGITIKNSPFWTVNPVGCNDVRISGISIFNPDDGYNTDGINPSSCSNVRISDCFISVGDDCITIKSGRDEYGREYGRPCENITVTNCVMLARHGGVVIGSEMSGGVKNVTISNCVFDGTDNGIRLKSARGRGGVVENIRISNIVMRDIRKIGFIFDLFYDKGTQVEPVTERTPIFRNIHISDVTGVGVQKVGELTGIEEMPVNEISFSNIAVKGQQGFIAQRGTNLHFSNVDIAVEEGPSLSFADCHQVVLNDVRSGKPLNNQPVIEIVASSQVLVHNCYQMVPADIFTQISQSQVLFGTNFLDHVKQPKLEK